MTYNLHHTYTLFCDARRVASGALADVAMAASTLDDGRGTGYLVFSDVSGEQVELDLRGGRAAILERYAPAVIDEQALPRGRGRPKLGVVAREVTLLPEHWEWLGSQPGGASVTLRKLVQGARRAGAARERIRRSQERCYKVMVALAGNLPGFEEAARALFAGNRNALLDRMKTWPVDVREHLVLLSDPEYGSQGEIGPDATAT
ncbi:MAG: DUF2239 family protein [Ramlibacter sp.]